MSSHLSRIKLILLYCLLAACGSEDNSVTAPSLEADFSASLITEFTSWTPVLEGDVAFASSGHSGQTVRVYFNDIAKPYFTGEKALPFAENAVIAKAVVANRDTSAKNASKVYFMRKKSAGFDNENANWSYAEATGSIGNLSFSGTTGARTGCSDCHSLEKDWDYVRTIDYFRRKVASEF
ncbi:MAG: cytochrome P460 family protein [Oligoflexales bacterium]|nr:cytochrome P460 family protein [Oligoflexales bacterium]